MTKETFKKYLLWAFIPAWALQVAASLLYARGYLAVYSSLLAVSMFVPMLAAKLAKVPFKPMGWKPKLRGNVKWLLLAWYAPTLLGVLGAALYFLLFPGRLDTTGAYLLSQSGGSEMLAQIQASGISLPAFVAIQAASSMIYAPFINMFFAVGEEAGWRGALNPYLKERFGKTRGLLLGGAIWGAWHWPIMLLSGYEYGKVYFGSPLSGMLAFCVITISMGILLDFLYEKSGSVWLPALAHGAINAFAGVPILLLNPNFLDCMILGPSMVGLIGGLPMIIAAAVLLLKKPRQAEQ